MLQNVTSTLCSYTPFPVGRVGRFAFNSCHAVATAYTILQILDICFRNRATRRASEQGFGTVHLPPAPTFLRCVLTPGFVVLIVRLYIEMARTVVCFLFSFALAANRTTVGFWCCAITARHVPTCRSSRMSRSRACKRVCEHGREWEFDSELAETCLVRRSGTEQLQPNPYRERMYDRKTRSNANKLAFLAVQWNCGVFAQNSIRGTSAVGVVLGSVSFINISPRLAADVKHWWHKLSIPRAA